MEAFRLAGAPWLARVTLVCWNRTKESVILTAAAARAVSLSACSSATADAVRASRSRPQCRHKRVRVIDQRRHQRILRLQSSQSIFGLLVSRDVLNRQGQFLDSQVLKLMVMAKLTVRTYVTT